MKRTTRLALTLLLVAMTVGCDRSTKTVARGLRELPSRSYLGDVIRIEYAENPGGFLSLGADLSPALRFWVFTILVAGFLAAVAGRVALGQRLKLLEIVGLSLLAGGGLGNWLDRVLNHGLVVDFMNVGIGGLRTGIFNVADLAITLGLVLLLMATRDGSGQLEAA
ncbi:MAG: signal peptidase II [Acidobacteriota bacterium]|nr:signal peptidase II [Acidobacteriota bacterium]